MDKQKINKILRFNFCLIIGILFAGGAWLFLRLALRFPLFLDFSLLHVFSVVRYFIGTLGVVALLLQVILYLQYGLRKLFGKPKQDIAPANSADALNDQKQQSKDERRYKGKQLFIILLAALPVITLLVFVLHHMELWELTPCYPSENWQDERFDLWVTHSMIISLLIWVSHCGLVLVVIRKSSVFDKVCYLTSQWPWILWFLWSTEVAVFLKPIERLLEDVFGGHIIGRLWMPGYAVSIFLLIAGVVMYRKWKAPLFALLYNGLWFCWVFTYVMSWCYIYGD